MIYALITDKRATLLESDSDKKDFEILVRDVVLKGPPPFLSETDSTRTTMIGFR